MKTRPELPKRDPWTVTLTPQTWTELSPEEARAHILAGNSCLVTGPAGSGKSTLVANIIKELRAERPVALISKTHVASQNMQSALESAVRGSEASEALEGAESAASGGEAYQATTADAFTRRHVCHGTYAGAIWLDEYSTLDFQQYCLLNALTYNGCQFVVSGDVNQMGACFSSFRGIPVDSDEISQSSFFYQLCGAHVCRLTECRRSDRPLFDWYTSVGAGGSRHGLPLAEQVRQARAAFPAAGRARWHLVVSHFKRLAINRREMLRQRPRDAIFVPRVLTTGMTCASQDMWVWPGMQLFACVRSVTKGLRNGLLYSVEAVGETLAVGGATLSLEEASKWLRPSFTQTYASSQGLTLEGRVQLCDIGHKNFTTRIRLMGLSRARGGDLVQVCD